MTPHGKKLENLFIKKDLQNFKLFLGGELTCDVYLWNKQVKRKAYVLRNATNLFGTDWMELFELLDLLINTYGKNVSGQIKKREKLKSELSQCSKFKVNFQVKKKFDASI